MANQQTPANPQQNLTVQSAFQPETQFTTQRHVVASEAFSASQTLWFEQRRALKRGPPTPAVSAAATPHTDASMGGAEASSTPTQSPEQSLFQPVTVDADLAYSMTAAQSGVDINNPNKIQQWLQQPVPTRAEVLQTVRAYHIGVIRPELYNFVAQIEAVISALDDRVLRQNVNLQWMQSENRQMQKQASGLMVLLTGFDSESSPSDRLYMINWMLQQVDHIRAFLNQRGYQGDNYDLYYLNALQSDPSTPPSGKGWSNITILNFKSWDLRKEFMSYFGGSGGSPYWKDSSTHLRGHHIRATPSSPQFQRKLEAPLRVVLSVINKSNPRGPPQMTILWKTLTIMSPQEQRAFDPQATACCRLHYYEKDGVFQGLLEVDEHVFDLMGSTPPQEAEEDNLWAWCWNQVIFGPQHELDVAERNAFKEQAWTAKGTGKGIKMGKGARHWTAPTIYTSDHQPYPVGLHVQKVESVAYCWDEYCDKYSQNDAKVGDYKAATYKGAPSTPQPQNTGASVAAS